MLPGMAILQRHRFGGGAVAAVAAAVLCALGGINAARAADAPPRVTVFAAASLAGSLDAVASAFKAATRTDVAISYAASSALAKQIEQAAPADVYISSDLDWMDYLEQKSLIAKDTRTNILGNRLVLVAPAASKTEIKLERGVDLAGALGEGRLAVADVETVPAGKYAKAALDALGVWTSVEAKLAQAENVRAALAFVARGEAPLGIVYNSDAVAEPGVRVVAVFPYDAYPRIVYPAAALPAAPNGESARAFILFLKTPPALAIFEKAGFLKIDDAGK